MLKKIISIALTVFMMIQGISTPVFASTGTGKNNNVTLEDIEQLLASQEKEFNKKVYVYGAAGAAGAALIGGGIYVYYTQKQIAMLKKRNLVLSYKVSKIENMINNAIKDDVSINRKVAKNTKLVQTNKAYIDELVKYVEDIIGALNSHSEAINSLAEEAAEEAAENAVPPRRPIGFNAAREASEEAAKKTEAQLTKGLQSVKNIGKKAGVLGILIAGVVAASYVYHSSEKSQTPISSKRIAYKRYLENAYRNNEGFFILDVLALSGEDRAITASILHESVGTDTDYYELFVKQQQSAKEAASEAKAVEDIRAFSDEVKSDNDKSIADFSALFKGSAVKDYINGFAI